jgi:hypothetical protein
MSGRFEKSWAWSGVFRARFWGQLLSDSYFLLPFALAAFLPGRSRRHLWLPSILFVTFVLMYAPADRIGNQYQLMFLPWLAWLIAEGVLRRIPVSAVKLVEFSALTALLAVAVIQYIPMRTHKVEPPAETEELRRLARESGVRQIIFDMSPERPNFIWSSPFVWYADLVVDYTAPGGAIAAPDPRKVYVLVRTSRTPAERAVHLRRAGWCEEASFPNSTIWVGCPPPMRTR